MSHLIWIYIVMAFSAEQCLKSYYICLFCYLLFFSCFRGEGKMVYFKGKQLHLVHFYHPSLKGPILLGNNMPH